MSGSGSRAAETFEPHRKVRLFAARWLRFPGAIFLILKMRWGCSSDSFVGSGYMPRRTPSANHSGIKPLLLLRYSVAFGAMHWAYGRGASTLTWEDWPICSGLMRVALPDSVSRIQSERVFAPRTVQIT